MIMELKHPGLGLRESRVEEQKHFAFHPFTLLGLRREKNRGMTVLEKESTYWDPGGSRGRTASTSFHTTVEKFEFNYEH